MASVVAQSKVDGKGEGAAPGFIIHTVDPDADSLVGLAMRYGVSQRAIRKYNDFAGVRRAFGSVTHVHNAGANACVTGAYRLPRCIATCRTTSR